MGGRRGNDLNELKCGIQHGLKPNRKHTKFRAANYDTFRHTRFIFILRIWAVGVAMSQMD